VPSEGRGEEEWIQDRFDRSVLLNLLMESGAT
jgi:hypothetical protein